MAADETTYTQDRQIRNAAMSESLLERDEELDLARRWIEERDVRARERMISSHQRLVVSIASRFRRASIPFQDLVNEGNLGLMKAVDRFDPSQGYRLSTYAGWWIHTAVSDYVMKNQTVVRLGRARAERDALRRMAGRPNVSDEEVAQQIDGIDALGVSFLRGALHTVSFEGSVSQASGEEIDYGSIVADERTGASQLMDDAMQDDRRAVIARFLEGLDVREREVLTARHLGDDNRTLREIAEGMGISPERVRQIEQGALTKMRRRMMRAGYHGRDLIPDPRP